MKNSAIIELRQYTLHPGRRDTLIELFDRDFVESQEATGMQIIGQFRVIDDADRFLWLRGFESMSSRARALAAFYGGPVWKAHRNEANATMIDSDNVLLLRPGAKSSNFELNAQNRPALDEPESATRTFVASIYYFREPIETTFAHHFNSLIAPAITAMGGAVCGYFVTERSPNNFPALPVREEVNAFVWLAAFPADSGTPTLSQPDWQQRYIPFADKLAEPIEIRRLIPTARSLLR
jgi:NIPSNAP